MKTYEVKIGHGVQRWESPYDFYVPQPKDMGFCGAAHSIEEALDNPIASPSLEDLAKNAKNIVIVVPDVTRGWCNAPSMNAAVRRRIASVTAKPVTWIVGTGQHRAVEEKDKAFVFGGSLQKGDTWLCHDCTKAVSTGLVTPSGTPVILNPVFLAADLVVLVGGIIFHDMAGFSGGRKLILPAVSGRAAIIANHNHCLLNGDLNPATNAGLLEHNPMAIDQHDYANLALKGKKCFLLNTVANSQGKPAAWVAGDIWKAWEVGCDACRSFDSIYIPRKAARCISSSGGFPFDLDLYQASKAMFSPMMAMEPGAPVVLVADLEDSLGPGDFADSLRWALKDPAGFAKHLETAFAIPGYIALRTVLEPRANPSAIVTSREDVLYPGKVFRTVAEADAWLQDVSGLDGLSILVPSGNAIHVVAES